MEDQQTRLFYRGDGHGNERHDPARFLIDTLRTSGLAVLLRGSKLVVSPAEQISSEQKAIIRANAQAIASRLAVEIKQAAAFEKFLTENPDYPPSEGPVPSLMFIECFSGEWHCVYASAWARWLASLDSASRFRSEIKAREASDQAAKNREREKKSMKARRKWQNHLPTGELCDGVMSPPASQ